MGSQVSAVGAKAVLIDLGKQIVAGQTKDGSDTVFLIVRGQGRRDNLGGLLEDHRTTRFRFDLIFTEPY